MKYPYAARSWRVALFTNSPNAFHILEGKTGYVVCAGLTEEAADRIVAYHNAALKAALSASPDRDAGRDAGLDEAARNAASKPYVRITQRMLEAGMKSLAQKGSDPSVVAADVFNAMLTAYPKDEFTSPSAGEREDHSKDFQMMLARFAHRAKKGLPLEETIKQAEGLLARKGTLSPLRDDTAPPALGYLPEEYGVAGWMPLPSLDADKGK